MTDEMNGSVEDIAFDTIEIVRNSRSALMKGNPNAAAVSDAIFALTIAADALVDYEDVFRLHWKANQRAIKRWRTVHPESGNTFPDEGDLLVWLMDQVIDLKEAITQAQTLFQHLRRTQTWPDCCSKEFADQVDGWLTDPMIFPGSIERSEHDVQ